MEKPLVSIIIPIYNVEQYIRNCLQSVVLQTYTCYEIILVNDGSKDNSVQIALNYLDTFPNIKYKLVEQSNLGLGEARNKGFEMSEGEWILFLDSDDTIQPDTIELLVKAAESTMCDFAFCDFQRVSLGEEFKLPSYRKGTVTYSSRELQDLFLQRKKRVLAPGTLYRRSWYKENNLYFEKIRFSEDIHFLWRAILAAKKVCNVQIPLYNYLIRANSIMSCSEAEKIIEGYKEIEKLYYEFQDNVNVNSTVKKWMLSRWVLGVMHTSVFLMEWKVFSQFCKKINVKSRCKELVKFPDFRVRIFAIMVLINLKLYYRIIKKVG